MHPHVLATLLTFSQAVIVAALPRSLPGQSDTFVEVVEVIDFICSADCPADNPSPFTELTTIIVQAQIDTLSSSPVETTSLVSSNDAVIISSLDSSNSISIATIVNTGPTPEISTITLTALPSVQTPTLTSASQPFPDTSGSVNATLDTAGRPPSQPFPTGLPSITESTLQPLNTTAPFNNATSVDVTITQTITIPLTTVETVIVTSTVTQIPVPITVTVTQVTILNSTIVANGTTLITPVAGTTVVITTGTALSQTTLTGVSLATQTVAVTLTANGSIISLPTPSASCVFAMGCAGQNMFLPVALGQPPLNIPQRGDHPVTKLGINQDGPIQTNKFYANFFLGSQGQSTFVVPYSLSWSKGSGNAQSWGMAVSHIEDNQKVFGPPNGAIPGSPDAYFINPIGIQSVILSAAELGANTVLTSNSLAEFSANIVLEPAVGSVSSITFPVVQGMGMVTGIYQNLQPSVQSSIFFRSVSAADNPKDGVYKYRLVLEDGKTWLLYATPSNGIPPNLKLISSTLLQGLAAWSGTIQIAKVPDPSQEFLYDAACGVYAQSGVLAGYTDSNKAEYSLSWSKGGTYANNGTLLMYALPHHVASFGVETSANVTNMTLQTNTKGVATAVVADYWVLEEDNLPVSMAFAPWQPGSQNSTTLSAAAIAAIQQIAPVEASQDMIAQTNLNSMYYSGKGLSKFASIVYAMNDLSDQKNLAAAALANLKAAFQIFVDQQQAYPLVYDTVWKGIVSSATYATGDVGADFGNSLYNDHHFHYGYFIYAAAVIGYMDPSWLTANKDYVNALVRDVANPSQLDQFFPIFRAFDWYHGHSWAKGLYESADGKDQESTSEDTMFAYALKLWGKTIGDASMEARGNLMLSVLKRSLQNYFLLESTNKNQPASFIGNKVTGILFENKVDHTTYFGTNLEYIQGIHMLPLQPFSPFTRNFTFVLEEWDTYFGDGAADQAISVQGGWKGVLYSNLGIINPTASFNFFTQPNFDNSWLDGGASRTWYIALAAGWGGSP